jgi:hypothetical protein
MSIMARDSPQPKLLHADLDYYLQGGGVPHEASSWEDEAGNGNLSRLLGHLARTAGGWVRNCVRRVFDDRLPGQTSEAAAV